MRVAPAAPVILALLAVMAWWVFCIASGGASPDPAKWLLHQTGFAALCVIVAVIGVSPARRLFRNAALTRWRRPLGLAAFFLACAHALVYTTVYQGFALAPIVDDITKHPYIMLGMLAWLLMLPLALTSTLAAQRRLGRHWKRLHRAVFVIVPVAVLHQALAQKADLSETIVFALVAGCFLAERALRAVSAQVKAKKSRNPC